MRNPLTQEAFVAAALDPTAPVPQGITGADGHPTIKRFNVYRNNIVVGLKDALATGFPAVRSLVGAEFFDAMAGTYVRTHPPRSPLMPAYGESFADFLDGFEPAKSLPYLGDVARLEYALRAAYHAADAAPVEAEKLRNPLAFTRSVTLAPALHVLRSPFPVSEIRAAALGGPKPTGGAEDVIVMRPTFDPTVTAFPSGTATIIEALTAGRSLGAALELAPAALDVSAFVTALLTGGAIIALEDL